MRTVPVTVYRATQEKTATVLKNSSSKYATSCILLPEGKLGKNGREWLGASSQGSNWKTKELEKEKPAT